MASHEHVGFLLYNTGLTSSHTFFCFHKSWLSCLTFQVFSFSLNTWVQREAKFDASSYTSSAKYVCMKQSNKSYEKDPWTWAQNLCCTCAHKHIKMHFQHIFLHIFTYLTWHIHCSQCQVVAQYADLFFSSLSEYMQWGFKSCIKDGEDKVYHSCWK